MANRLVPISSKWFLVLSLLLGLPMALLGQTSVYSVHEGDSTTSGDGVNGSNYVFFLKEMAVGHVFPLVFTNIALGGDTISNNYTATDTLLRLTDAPYGSRIVATVYLGLNDISLGFPYEYTTTNLLSWITNVYHSFPQAKILICTIWPRTGEIAATKGLLRSNINHWIRTTAPANIVVDFAYDDRLNPIITPANFLDNVHPNIIGHQIMASNIWTLMQSAGYFDSQTNTLGTVAPATLIWPAAQ